MSSTQQVTQHPTNQPTNQPLAAAAADAEQLAAAAAASQPAGGEQQVPEKEITSFDDLDINEALLRGIYNYGFETPSTIQKLAIPKLLTGRDTIAQAQSGTGKTATFSIAILQLIDPSKPVTQALVLEPTRELAEQSCQVLSDFSAPHMHDVFVKLLIGGRRTGLDIEGLRKGPQVVVGTPGRVMHMIQKGFLNLSECRICCLDEADEMLSFGFKDQVYDIFQFLPTSSQVALVSATMPPEVLDLSKRFLREPHRILLEKDEVKLDGIAQFYIALDSDEDKFATLCDVYSMLTINSSIIFCNTRRQVDQLHEAMEKDGFSVSKIHGDMEQRDRDLALTDFRMGASRVLISSDVLAKGIDVQSVAVVVNYNLPREKEFYIHRIGRAGRFGRRGVAVNMATARDFKFLRELQEHYDMVIEEMPMSLKDNTVDFLGA